MVPLQLAHTWQGVVALILSVNPNLTAKQVADIIEQTAQKVGGYNYQNVSGRPNGTWNNEMGYGLVDAYEAVKKAKSMLVPKPLLTAPNMMPWGFCRKATFKVENFPTEEKNATIDWKYPRGSRVTKEIAKNEVEIDFGSNYRAEVHAIVNTQDYKNLDLEYVNTNNNYVRSDMLCLKVESQQGNRQKIKFLLDSLNLGGLSAYQRQKLINIETHNCTYQKEGENEYISIYGDNPYLKATITLAPETCPDEPVTFSFSKIGMPGKEALIHSEESLAIANKPEASVEECSNPNILEGEIVIYKWQGAREVYFDFVEHYGRFTDEEKYVGHLNWVQSPDIGKVYKGYFEFVPANGYVLSVSPQKIEGVASAKLHIESPRYVGFRDWGKAWMRYVTDVCKVSEWELIDFSKITFVTNGYFVYRDKGYSPGEYYMYPNPATNRVFFSVKPQTESRRGVSLFSATNTRQQKEPYQIEVFNTAGVRVLHSEGKGTTAEFSVAHLPAGIYIVHFTQNGVTHKEKLIVE